MSESSVLGIKFESTASEAKFVRFFSIVQDAAAKMGKVFFLDAGDGRELITDGVDGEDLSGWLVDKSDIEAFKPGWLAGMVDDRFDDDYAFAEWHVNDDGSITITFS